MERREIERILAAIRDVRAAGERAALATVVRVKGSAYRREGTQILVRQNGTYECLLSGGCLEPSVAEAAARVIATGTPLLQEYDLAEDSVWGLNIGCSGAVDILIERIEDDDVTDGWLACLEHGTPAVLVTPLAGASGRLLVGQSGDPAGQLAPAGLLPLAVADARARLQDPHPRSGPAPVDGAELFFQVHPPTPRIVIFGAGPDAQPLARGAWELGFAVTVVDVRDAFLTPERFPHATLVRAHYSRFRELVPISPAGFIVVMNHHVERDRECLRFGLESGAFYVGILGPRSRFRRLLGELASDGCTPAPGRVARVRSPVGLALGGETPEEVALSILGEIVAVRRGFQGGFLSGLDASLHRASDSRLFARS